MLGIVLAMRWHASSIEHRALGLAGFAIALSAAIPPAHACSCLAHSLAEHVCRTPYIFEGEAIETVEELPAQSGVVPWRASGSATTKFRILKAWKGVALKEVSVRHNTSSAACGVKFTPGEVALVFANESEQGLATGLCMQIQAQGATTEDYARALAIVRDRSFRSEAECLAALAPR
jgi:hypothetical protein